MIVRLIRITFLLSLVVVLLGGWTRINYAGLGCPDWPGCYGELVVPYSAQAISAAQASYPDQPIDAYKAWLEMLHRYVAGLLGVLVLAIAVLYRRTRPENNTAIATLGPLPYLLLGVVIVQALFGMWTVTLQLTPAIVTAHLLGGLTTVTLLFLMQRRVSHGKPQSTHNKPRVLHLAALLLITQLLLGGWTSANYAGWACDKLVQCNNLNHSLDFSTGFTISYDPNTNYEGGTLPLEARAAIQMTHRAVGLVLIITLLAAALQLRHSPSQATRAWCCASIAVLQAIIGFSASLLAVPLPLAMAHHIGAVAVLLSFLWLYLTPSTLSVREVRYAAA